MKLDEVLDLAVAEARRVKEHVCRKRPSDIKAMVDVLRGDELIAAVVVGQHERDEILRVFRGCAIGFDADTLALTHESYASATRLPADLDHLTEQDEEDIERSRINPLTGQPWGPGEMQEAAIHHGGLEKGWVHEVLSISCANRAGDIAVTMLPYRYASRHVVWGERLDMPAGMRAEGTMPEAMVEAMNTPSLGAALPYPPTESPRAQRDVWIAEAMMQQLPCWVGLYSAAGNRDRLRVLRAIGTQLGD